MAKNDIDVRLRLQGGRRFQTQAAGAATSVDAIGKSGHSAGRHLARFGTVLGGAVVVGVGAAVKSAADFQQQMSSLGAVTSAGAGTMDKFRASALKAGADTAFSASDAATAQIELAKGGLAASTILGGGLKASLNLAAAGQLALGDAASYTVNALQLFSLKGKDAGSVADAFAVAANATTADVGDFGEALKQGGSVAKTVGLSFNATVTALEALATSGIKGSDAGTSLKTALLHLVNPTNSTMKTMERLGLSFKNSHGAMKSLGDISGMLRDKLGGQGKAQRAATLATLAGTDGVRTLTALYDAGPKVLAKYSKGLANSGYAARVAAAKQNNLKGKIESLKGSMETLGISVGTVVIPPLTSLAVKLTGIVNSATSAIPKLKALATGVADGFKGTDRKLSAAKAYGANDPDRRTSVLTKPKPTAAHKVGAALKSAGKSAIGLGKGLLDALKPAAPFLNNILLPALKGFGKGVLGSIVGILKIAIPVIKVAATVLGFVGRVLKPLGPLFKGVGLVVGYLIGPGILGKVLTVAKEAGKGLKIFEVAAKYLGAPLRALGGQVKALAGKFPAIGNAIRRVQRVVATAAVIVHNAVSSIIKAITGAVGRVGAAAVRLGSRIFNGVMRAVMRLPGGLGGAFAKVAGDFGGIAKTLGQRAIGIGKAIVKGVVDGIKSIPGAIGSAVGNFGQSALDTINPFHKGPKGRAQGGAVGIGERYTLTGEQGREIAQFPTGTKMVSNSRTEVKLRDVKRREAGPPGGYVPQQAPAAPVQQTIIVKVGERELTRVVLDGIHTAKART